MYLYVHHVYVWCNFPLFSVSVSLEFLFNLIFVFSTCIRHPVLWPSYGNLSAIKCFLSVENIYLANKCNVENDCRKIHLQMSVLSVSHYVASFLLIGMFPLIHFTYISYLRVLWNNSGSSEIIQWICSSLCLCLWLCCLKSPSPICQAVEVTRDWHERLITQAEQDL